MAKEDVQKCLEWLLNTQVSLLPVFLLSHSRTLSSRIVYICKNYENISLAKIPLIFSKLCRKWQGRDGFTCKVCFLFYPPHLCLFSIFSQTKPIVFTSTCTFLSRHLKCKKITGFLSAKSFLILQIKVRHKVFNRSERVKYMYTCILFVDFIIMIKIQPVGCPIAISLSVRFYLLRALLVFRFPVYHFAQTSTTECLLVGNSQLFG